MAITVKDLEFNTNLIIVANDIASVHRDLYDYYICLKDGQFITTDFESYNKVLKYWREQ